MTPFLHLSTAILIGFLSTAALGYPTLASAQEISIEGRIQEFQCGDNCYLTIVDNSAKKHTGLCTASACGPWNENVELPPHYIGKRVIVTLGRGVQTDAEGNVMGKMTAFRKIRFLDQP
jgi:hypothetical protein